MATTIKIRIETPHWLKRSVIYIGEEHQAFFPYDCLGARGKADEVAYPKRGTSVTFVYDHENSDCDVATVKGGHMRPRETGYIQRFYERHGASVGDHVVMTRQGDRTYMVTLEKQY